VSFLLDTNVLSEIRKGNRGDARVAAWFAAVAEDDLYLSVLVLGEIRQGVERLRPRDPAQAAALDRWLGQVSAGFAGRVLGIDAAVAAQWGRLGAIRPVPAIDALMAATALVHGLTLVTRNDRDLAGLGVAVLNPFRVAA